MEFGEHRTIDFLNMSLNMPLNYHHLSLYSAKYTKSLEDFLKQGVNYKEVKDNPELKKRLLKVLNNILYLNNHLYNSDRSEMDYRQTGASFVKARIGTKAKRGDNQ